MMGFFGFVFILVCFVSFCLCVLCFGLLGWWLFFGFVLFLVF